MPYSVLFTEKALKYLKKIDRCQAKLIISWVKKQLLSLNNKDKNHSNL